MVITGIVRYSVGVDAFKRTNAVEKDDGVS